MFKFLARSAVLGCVVFVGCKSVDLDVPLSDDKTSAIDPRLLGIWEFVQKTPDESSGSCFVGKKVGTQNTLDVAMVGLEKDLSVSVHHLDMFARMAKHNYLTLGDTQPDASRIGPRWLLARYEIAPDGTVQVHFLKADAFRKAIRREILQKRLKGEIKGLRRRSDWVFALEEEETQQLVYSDSSEALVRFLDQQGDSLFEEKATVLKRSSADSPAAVAARTKLVPPASPVPAAPPAPAPPQHPPDASGDDVAPQLPQSFEVAARLLRPGDYQPGKLEAFRSVALRIPWAYVLDRTGTLCVFRLPEGGAAKDLQPTKILEDAADGDDLTIFGDVLICTRSGAVEAYSLQTPGDPRPLGTFGPKLRFGSQSIVRHGQIAFLLCGMIIQSYDLTVPAKPRFLGRIEAQHAGWVGTAAGSFLYVGQAGGGHRGIAVYDVSTPAHPTEVAFVPVSHVPYHVFATPKSRLIVSMDGEGMHWVSSSHISVNGNSAVFDLAHPKQPRLVKEYGMSGGRTAALLSDKEESYFACNGVIFAVKNEGLEPNSVFYPEGSTLDGLPYHGAADGKYVAVPADNVVQVLRLKDAK